MSNIGQRQFEMDWYILYIYASKIFLKTKLNYVACVSILTLVFGGTAFHNHNCNCFKYFWGTFYQLCTLVRVIFTYSS